MSLTAARPLKPDWIKVSLLGGEQFSTIKNMLRGRKLHTVCEEAHCPNISECWQSGTATFMLLGDTCTRGCRFCNVKTGNPHGLLDPHEPENIAASVTDMQLRYVVLTTVDRDDLPDSGATHFSETVRLIRQHSPHTLIEVLVGDFGGNRKSMETMLASNPDVYAHNLETVERLTPRVRDHRATYIQSLDVLRVAKEIMPALWTKSSLMLGLGETRKEIEQTMGDLRETNCDILTLGQYLQPSPKHLPVIEFIHPDQFDQYRVTGESMGFAYVASGPLVRSSYKAGEFFLERQLQNGC